MQPLDSASYDGQLAHIQPSKDPESSNGNIKHILYPSHPTLCFKCLTWFCSAKSLVKQLVLLILGSARKPRDIDWLLGFIYSPAAGILLTVGALLLSEHSMTHLPTLDWFQGSMGRQSYRSPISRVWAKPMWQHRVRSDLVPGGRWGHTNDHTNDPKHSMARVVFRTLSADRPHGPSVFTPSGSRLLPEGCKADRSFRFSGSLRCGPSNLRA